MTSKKKKPRQFVSEQKTVKREPEPAEKPKYVKERIIEEHMKGMETPIIAQRLAVSRNFVTKVVYLHKQSESTIIRPAEPSLKEEEFGLGVAENIVGEQDGHTEAEINAWEAASDKDMMPHMYDSTGKRLAPGEIEKATVVQHEDDQWKTTNEEIPLPPATMKVTLAQVEAIEKQQAKRLKDRLEVLKEEKAEKAEDNTLIGKDFVKGVKQGIKACGEVLKEEGEKK